MRVGVLEGGFCGCGCGGCDLTRQLQSTERWKGSGYSVTSAGAAVSRVPNVTEVGGEAVRT